MIVTKEYMNKHKTKKGSWTRSQINALGESWPLVKGWYKRVIGKEISPENMVLFEQKLTASQERRRLKSLGKKYHQNKLAKSKPFKSGVKTFPKRDEQNMGLLKANKHMLAEQENSAARRLIERYETTHCLSSEQWLLVNFLVRDFKPTVVDRALDLDYLLNTEQYH